MSKSMGDFFIIGQSENDDYKTINNSSSFYVKIPQSLNFDDCMYSIGLINIKTPNVKGDKEFYVCCNLCVHSWICTGGLKSVQLPLLRVCEFNAKKTYVNETFNTPLYVSVNACSRIQYLEISIKGSDGELISPVQNKSTSVVLHCKKHL